MITPLQLAKIEQAADKLAEESKIDGMIEVLQVFLTSFDKTAPIDQRNLDLIRKPVGTITAWVEELEERKQNIINDINKA